VDIGEWDPIKVALEEYRRGLIDYYIIRDLPDGKSEIWTKKDIIPRRLED
jgi:DNA-directed RNA polymerase subunit K/omega